MNKTEERVVKDWSTIMITLNIPTEDIFDGIKNVMESKLHDTCHVNIHLKYSRCEKYKTDKELFTEEDNSDYTILNIIMDTA